MGSSLLAVCFLLGYGRRVLSEGDAAGNIRFLKLIEEALDEVTPRLSVQLMGRGMNISFVKFQFEIYVPASSFTGRNNCCIKGRNQMIEYLKRKEGKSWLIAWGVVVVSLIVSLLIDPQLQSQLGDSKLYPGTEPPWYFIQRDFISSLSSVIGVITSLPFIFAVSTRYKLDWSPAVFMLFVCYVDSIYEGLVIFFRSGNVLDIAQAKVAWPTFGAYMAETKMNVVPIFLVLAVGIGMVFRQRYLYKTRGPSTLPSA